MVFVYWMRLEEAIGREKRRAEHDAGHSLLVCALEEQYGISAKESRSLKLLEESHGKPYLAGEPRIHFNISHSGGVAVCAVGANPVGVDVERIRPFDRRLSERVLSPDELEQLAAEKEELRQELFYKFWTLKESYLKAEGWGISVLPLSEVSFCLGNDGEVFFGKKGWSFRQQKLAGDYVLSVCSRTGEAGIRIIEKDYH